MHSNKTIKKTNHGRISLQLDENPSEHILDVMTSTLMTRDKLWQGGGFVQAVVSNDLIGAIGRADKDVLANLRLIVLAYYNAQFENQ